MKKNFTLLLFLLISITSFSQSNYAGNGKSGFGGPIGTGSLDVSDNGSAITFVLHKGTNDLNDALVIYIDSKSGGFTSTSGFLDHADGLRTAISGYNGTERSTLNFPASFTPDYVVALDASFAGVWELKAGSTEHAYITSANLSPLNTKNSPTFTFTVNKSDIGLPDLITFKFLGTYISNSAYRSEEAIGDLMTGFTQGYNDQTILTSNTYPSSILPVKLTEFKAAKDKSKVLINWSVAQESNIESYQVQRSKDGVNFSALQSIAARNQSAYQPKYSLTDDKPLNGVNYYRLLIKENGRVEMSKIITVTMGQKSGNISVNYIPGSNKVNLKLIGADAGVYSVSVVSAVGQVVQNISLDHDGTEVNKSISLKGGLSKGIYRVVLMNADTRISQAFLVQ